MLLDDLSISITRFIDKSKDYPPEGFRFLGQKGQFSDIARKFFKLKAAVWDGKKLEGEGPDEIIDDTIGHLIILLYLRRNKLP